MTRSPADLLRDVATALTCYASTKHAQASVQKIHSIKAAMLEEVAHIEALEREVRETMRAQAEAGAGEITWDAAVARLMQGGNLVLTARGDSELLSALLREASDRLGDGEMHVHEEFEAGGLWYREQQGPAQIGAPAPCICGGVGRVLIDDDAEVHCPHCPTPSNITPGGVIAEEPETLLERILDTLHNCRDFKLAAPDRDGEWTASFTYDRCDFEGRGSSPEAALVEASVERTIADHYYYADGARLSEAQMTDLLNTAYTTHLGHLPGHGYRGSYLKEDVE